ncbi:Acylpyruvase FAHD1, mitochondrial [Hondaea fermentalgiana]|uniref:Acylpyruvase FAHD1, mitochondrial n=1 Tax=Hondaea fermentalgiana TaxID=2315210 RepID=A0A2R5G8C6_9STRA|nr:Acylpyruvase FAHD1, mitochondrial [Hondaea fermentalgiana]|eukprot:GBG26038.1 Acylpyruvase FAHD1, mitochondrial [Hondaea fermentalgiana]
MMRGFPCRPRTIAAIGRNYVEHAKELKNEAPKNPFWFLKPAGSLIEMPAPIELPQGVGEVHHEVELVVVMGSDKATRVPVDKAYDHVAGYAICIDITGRTLQSEAKEKRLPWSRAKGFDTFCPIGPFIPKDLVPDPAKLELWLAINGEERQRASVSNMVFNVPQLISAVTHSMTLERGDLILTGTPSGVGPMNPGDVVTYGVKGVNEEFDREMTFDVVKGPHVGMDTLASL